MDSKSKQIYIKSFGCPTNTADGEIIAGCLSKAGYDVVDKVENADILIYNTCAVKSPTENRMIDILRKISENKMLIVTGCLPLTNLERLRGQVRFDGLVSPAPGSKIIEVVRRVETGEKVVMLERNSKPNLLLPKIPTRITTSIIPINYGCSGSCSYCCVLHARGSVRSYQANEIIERVKRDIGSGIKEIWLTSQDTGCYGKDIATNLPNLLKWIRKVDGRFFIRIGMMTPNQALNILEELIEAYKHERIFKFLHLPVQSGDDQVLRRMNRGYSVEEFKRIIHTFKKEIPAITVATDIICGFPGESQAAFKRTVDLVKEIQPDIVNVSKFFPRPQTAAKELKPIPPREVKERSRKMAEVSREISLKRNEKWKKWKGPFLINEKGKSESWIGRNFTYKPIVVKSKESLLGRFVNGKVTKVFSTYLEAELFEEI